MNVKIDVNITASPELIGGLQALAALVTGTTRTETAAAQPAPAAPPPVAPVPTSTQTYTLEQLAVAATPLADAGRRNDLVGLLNSFGVSALTQLPKEHYGAFATQLRAMGAKI